jgi:hypothetical protein
MATRSLSVKEGILYIAVSGVVLFFAVFLGIRAGFAIRGDGAPEVLTPDNLPNRSLLKPGDPLPPMLVKTAENHILNIADITEGKPTVVAVVLPGCGPCEKLLAAWRKKGIVHDENGIRIVLLTAAPPDEFDLGALSEFEDDFPVYFVEFAQLDTHCGISTFPSLIGITSGNAVGFVANGYVHRLENEFFEKYL